MQLHRVDQVLPEVDLKNMSEDDLKNFRASVGADSETGFYNINTGSTKTDIRNMAANLGIVDHPGLSGSTIVNYKDIANAVGFNDFDPQNSEDYNKLDEILRSIHEGRTPNFNDEDSSENSEESVTSENDELNDDSDYNVLNRYSNNRFASNQNGDISDYSLGRGIRNRQFGTQVSNDSGEETSHDEKKDENKHKNAKKLASKLTNDKDKKVATKTFLKNPYVIAFAALTILFVALVILMIVFKDYLTFENMYGTGEFPYVQMSYYPTIKVKDGGNFKYVKMEDYIAGVIANEAECFSSSMDMLKAQAIAARTYAQLKMKNQGYVINSTANQTYNDNPKYLDPNNKMYKASYETAGLVLVTGTSGSYKFLSTEYDALATGTECGGKVDNVNKVYVLCQKGVEVPMDWLKKQGLTGSWLNSSLKHYHGRGMSQWGAYYLAKEKKYTYKQILNLFYDNAQIVSLYPNEATGKVSLEMNETPSSATQITEPLKDFFKSKGTSLKEINDGLLAEVKKAGPGTREGVVTAALYTNNILLKYGKRMRYDYGGGHGSKSGDCSASSTYGFCPGWGTYSPHDTEFGIYKYTGIDCGRYVTWIFLNGGVKIYSSDDSFSADYGSGQFMNKAHTKKYSIYDSSYTGKPGDVLVKGDKNHAMLILKYKSSGSKGYYVAEASGKNNGIRIKLHTLSSLSSQSYKVVDMSWYYSHQKISNFESVFQNKRKA